MTELLCDPDNGAKNFSTFFTVCERINCKDRALPDDLIDFKTALGMPVDTNLSAETICALSELATSIGERAVKLTAVMCAVALSSRVAIAKEEERSLYLAIDSRVLEGLNRDQMFEKTLTELIGEVVVELVEEKELEPGNKISVPLLGAVRALFHFIDKEKKAA